MKKNVLILEDNERHFENLEIEFLGKGFQIYPDEDDDEWDFISLREMFLDIVDNKNVEQINNIVNKYKDLCNIYVIDRELASRRGDKLGMTFYQKFLECGIPKSDIFIVSSHPIESLGIDIENKQFQKKVSSFANLLIQNIK